MSPNTEGRGGTHIGGEEASNAVKLNCRNGSFLERLVERIISPDSPEVLSGGGELAQVVGRCGTVGLGVEWRTTTSLGVLDAGSGIGVDGGHTRHGCAVSSKRGPALLYHGGLPRGPTRCQGCGRMFIKVPHFRNLPGGRCTARCASGRPDP